MRRLNEKERLLVPFSFHLSFSIFHFHLAYNLDNVHVTLIYIPARSAGGGLSLYIFHFSLFTFHFYSITIGTLPTFLLKAVP